MRGKPLFSRLLRDGRGAAAIEFALLAPAVIVMLLGVLMIGLHMQSYNSVRSAAYDVNRYTVIEYQKENKLDEGQIAQVAAAIGSRSPYNFDVDRLKSVVVKEDSGISGAKKFVLTLSYTPPAISGLMKISPPTITQSQTIIVPE